MTHILKQFGHVPLATAMPRDDLSTGIVDTGLVDSIGSKFNYFGSAQRLPRDQRISHRGLYVGEMNYRVTSNGDFRVTSSGDYRVTAPSRAADLHGQVGDLKAMIGKWEQLWRERVSDGQMTWKQCRLLQVKHEEDVESANVVSEVESLFETLDVGWRSQDATIISVSASSGALAVLNVQNDGTLPITDALLRVARTSGTITQVRVYGGSNIDLTWAGSIGSGQTLVLDDEDKTVQIGSTDQYNGLSLSLSHVGPHWLPLAIGANLLYVVVTGGNATVSVEHWNQWP